jgi:hypothetical protein
MDQLAEYNVQGMPPVGHGKRIRTATITTPQLRHSVSDRAIQHMLENEISTNSNFPQPTQNTLYFIYLPPGVRVIQGGAPCGNPVWGTVSLRSSFPCLFHKGSESGVFL